MTRTIIRSAVLLGLGLTLTACAQHNPAQANCFNEWLSGCGAGSPSR